MTISDLCYLKQIYVWTSDLCWDNVPILNFLGKSENYRNMIIICNICSSMLANYRCMLDSLFSQYNQNLKFSLDRNFLKMVYNLLNCGIGGWGNPD